MTPVHGLVNAAPTSSGRWRFLCLCRDRFSAPDKDGAAELFREHLAEVDELAAAGGGA